MRSTGYRSTIVVCVCLTTILSSFWITRSVAAYHEPHVLLDIPAGHGGAGYPRTDGDSVVWSSGTGDSENAGVWIANTIDFIPNRIVATDLAIGDLDIDGNLLAWVESRRASDNNSELRGMHLDTGETFTIAVGSNITNVAVAGSRVVWSSYAVGGVGPATSTLFQTNITVGGAPNVLASTVGFLWGVAISGDTVAWMESGNNVERIVVADLARIPFELVVLDRTGPARGFDLAGNLLVYSIDEAIYMLDVTTGEDVQLDDVQGYGVQTDGRYVVWQEAYPSSDYSPGIRSLDLHTGQMVTITNNASAGTVEIGGGVVVWHRQRGGPHGAMSGVQIFAVRAGDRDPSSALPPPDMSIPEQVYFAETGHTLRSGFKEHWEANGGLSVLGYPLTEEFQEFNPDTEDVFAVQYFERQRLEWHPEHLGTPYAVLLGRVGVESLLIQRRDWTTMPTADPNTAHYVPETGHAIAPEFFAYWSSHGLNLGDAGTSYRESVALFGYPISEPILETNADGDTVLTQWFERAAFEWHPENPEEYRVLLRRLGAEMMTARGW